MWRPAALDWASRGTGPLVTTDAVLTGIADALCRADQRSYALEAIRSMRADPAP